MKASTRQKLLVSIAVVRRGTATKISADNFQWLLDYATKLETEIEMSLVATELATYKQKLADATAKNVADAATISDLNTKIAGMVTAPSPDHVMDDADVAAVAAAKTELGIA